MGWELSRGGERAFLVEGTGDAKAWWQEQWLRMGMLSGGGNRVGTSRAVLGLRLQGALWAALTSLSFALRAVGEPCGCGASELLF